MKTQKKLNNKGFSMVELVIVIAIMAVLIAVLAPQYIKYVETSRISTDDTNAAEVLKTVQLLVADGTISSNSKITWSNKTEDNKTVGEIADDVTADDVIKDAVVTALSGKVPSITSNKYAKATAPGNVYTVKVTFANSTAKVIGYWGEDPDTAEDTSEA